MRQGGTRKRPAPGMSPLRQDPNEIRNQTHNISSPKQNIRQFDMQALPISHNGLPIDSAFENNYIDPSSDYSNQYGDPYFNVMPEQNTTQGLGTEIVRKQAGNQVVPFGDTHPVARAEFGGAQPPVEQPWQEEVPTNDLDHRALLAQRDAQSKRKQIPPFIQKLSSFLDDNTRNTDLIRWSDSGDSFTVLDEDEFARTLIPELFKHNNYASFVRQLNMYGFHKKVGLSDNSMRASERKNKQPSEYSNPYFKRGKPNLLWLIHKPKSAASKGGGKGNNRAKQEDADEEVDDYFPHENTAAGNQETIQDAPAAWSRRQPLMLGATENKLPPDRISSIQQEIYEVRKNQQKLGEMLVRTRQENANLYNQAKAFHELHEKHDNSINAILSFLATVYNKNLKDGGLDMGNMFSSNALPHDQGHGNVVDMEDEKEPNSGTVPHQPPFKKRKPLLLKDKASPGNTAESPQQWNPNQWPANTLPYPTNSNHSPLHSPAVQEITDRTPSTRSSQSPKIHPARSPERNIPQADVLQVLNSTSAQNNNFTGPTMDFSEALAHLQTTDGQSPLTANQRQDMLKLMSNEISPQNGNENDALTSYSPPNSAATLAHFDHNTEQLNQIQQSLREQGARMANLQAAVVPLSPSGSIPGLNDPSFTPTHNGNDVDFDSMFNNDYFNSGDVPHEFDFSYTDIPDFNFGAPDMEPQNGEGQNQAGIGLDGTDEGRVKEMDSSEATSPANTVGTLGDDADAVPGQVEGSPKKLRRRY